MSTSDLSPDPLSEGGVSRRSLLTRSASAGVGIVLAGSVPGLFGGAALAKHGDEVGYGPLVPDPAGILSLPAGFSYTIVAQSGTTLLETGEPTPDDPDGTAAFKGHAGGTVLVNNHEIGGSEPFKVPPLPGLTYDPLAGGGTTNIEVDKDGNRIREYVSLAGTHNNCAGGITPWDTWVTCEETEGSPAGSTVRHGYNFEVDPYDQDANLDPKPLKFFGRFAHESIVVDPKTHVVYQTEDASNPNGLLYRWTPPAEALPLAKGKLKALADDAGTLDAMQAFTKRGEFVPDLSVYSQPGTRLKVKWVPVPDRDATTLSTRKQFAQITRSRKLEGMWWGDEGAYFVASFARGAADGSAASHDGQVWHYDPEEGRIELMIWFAYTPGDQDTDPDGPDNITVSPFGGVILAEDGEGVQHLVGATDDGETYFFARNELEGDNEFAGPTFSHNKKILFANVQSPGHVFAIQGPFRKQ